ncbi:hypothetical protein [Curtobacterium sp. ISL-83]|uniref:hypothetical protein n=1 Tax=Curtobacterium sp. ISL-83 TaxID=2819145 RepID=UPI001BE9DD13|nr:hypothetical protein [Curtobacterium sp. ISL-83]MBT2503884.1 hypothetical protein [Curtobacterium sp. ISL-83]
MTIIDEFRTLDTAPELRLTPGEEQRRDHLLAAIIQLDRGPQVDRATAAGTARRTTPARPRTVRTTVTIGATALLAAGALTVGGVAVLPSVVHHLLPGVVEPGTTAAGPLSAVSLASWTSSPAHPSAASTVVTNATAHCSRSMPEPSGNDAPVTVSNVDQRGSVTTVVLSRGGYRFFCLVGADGSGHSELVDGPGNRLPGVAGPASLSVQSADDSGSGATAISTLWGEAGADVASVTVSAGGHTLTATVDNGLWTAWWPPVGDSVDPLDGTVTWTTTTGASHSSSLNALVPGN